MVDPRLEPPSAVTVTVCEGGALRSSWLAKNVSIAGDSAMPGGAGFPPPAPPPPPPQPPATTSTSPKTRRAPGPLPRLAMDPPPPPNHAHHYQGKQHRQS